MTLAPVFPHLDGQIILLLAKKKKKKKKWNKKDSENLNKLYFCGDGLVKALTDFFM